MRHVQDEVLIAFIEGELEGEEARRVEEHLRNCRVCQDNYTAYLSLIRELEDLPPVPAPQELDIRLKRKIYNPVPLVGLFAFSAVMAISAIVIVEWFPRLIRWIFQWISLRTVADLVVESLKLVVKFYTITSSLLDPVIAVGVIVILSIMMAIVLRRRLEGYAGPVN